MNSIRIVNLNKMISKHLHRYKEQNNKYLRSNRTGTVSWFYLTYSPYLSKTLSSFGRTDFYITLDKERCMITITM